MIVQPTNMAALTWAGAAAGTLSDSWRVGSVLGGRVLDRNALGRLILQVGALTVEAEIADSAVPPRQFQARVVSNGPVPVLELLDTAGSQTPLAGLLRTQLPRQGGYAPLFAHLQALGQRPVARQLPEPARFALAMLEGATHTPADVSTPHGLREAVLRSGLFYEHDLAAAAREGTLPASLRQDFKGALMRVVRVLERLPATVPGSLAELPDVAPPLRFRPMLAQARMPALPAELDPVSLLAGMRDASRAALARLEIAQIEAHPAQPVAAWLVEVPVRGEGGTDVVQVRINHEEPDPAHPETARDAGPWTLGFAVDLPGMGPLQGEIRLDGRRVGVRLWAESDSAVRRLETLLPDISRRLEASGLQLLQLQCRRGSPQPSTTVNTPLLNASA